MNTETIGINAGIVWRTLYENEKEMNLCELVETTQLNLVEVAAAIGWLSRENKITTKIINSECHYSVYKECYY